MKLKKTKNFRVGEVMKIRRKGSFPVGELADEYPQGGIVSQVISAVQLRLRMIDTNEVKGFFLKSLYNVTRGESDG